jgi:hypothetical protein
MRKVAEFYRSKTLEVRVNAGSNVPLYTDNCLLLKQLVAIPDSGVEWTFDGLEDPDKLESDPHGIVLLSRDTELAMNNTDAFNLALAEARPGDTVLVPDEKSFTVLGGILVEEKHNLAIDIAGSMHFLHAVSSWSFANGPKSSIFDGGPDTFDPGLTVFNCTSITITSSSETLARVKVDYKKNRVDLDNGRKYRGGIVNGNGEGWWDDAISGHLPGIEIRPRLIHIMESEDVLLEKLTLLNSPYWTLTVEANRAEIREVNVLVDRKYQAALLDRNSASDVERRLDGFAFPFPIDDLPDWLFRKFNQPQDLNTDGIDPYGKDIWVHDCIIQNADDSVAVKPSHKFRRANSIIPDCTTNITFENLVLTGFGASVGSVAGGKRHSCIDGVTFRNISMPGTGKGKSGVSSFSCHG